MVVMMIVVIMRKRIIKWEYEFKLIEHGTDVCAKKESQLGLTGLISLYNEDTLAWSS